MTIKGGCIYYVVGTYANRGGEAFFYHYQDGGKAFFCTIQGGGQSIFLHHSGGGGQSKGVVSC